MDICALIFLALLLGAGLVLAEGAATSVSIIAGGGEAGTAAISFGGKAYPASAVTVLKDGQPAAAVTAQADASFRVELDGLTPGNYNFSIHSEDGAGNRSSLFSFSTKLSAGTVIEVNDIFLSPTLELEAGEVVRGSVLRLNGQTFPQAQVALKLDDAEHPGRVSAAGADGSYLYELNTSALAVGRHSLRVQARSGERTSLDSRTLAFTVLAPASSGGGGGGKGADPGPKKLKEDFNGDTRVNLVDFSIMAHWHKRKDFPPEVDLSGDGAVDLVDFSILVYGWTG